MCARNRAKGETRGDRPSTHVVARPGTHHVPRRLSGNCLRTSARRMGRHLASHLFASRACGIPPPTLSVALTQVGSAFLRSGPLGPFPCTTRPTGLPPADRGFEPFPAIKRALNYAKKTTPNREFHSTRGAVGVIWLVFMGPSRRSANPTLFPAIKRALN